MSAEKIARLFIIRIKSGPNTGRYVGMHFGGGLVTNPEVLNNPPVNVPVLISMACGVQKPVATRFLEVAIYNAAAELTQLGHDVEIIPVQ